MSPAVPSDGQAGACFSNHAAVVREAEEKAGRRGIGPHLKACEGMTEGEDMEEIGINLLRIKTTSCREERK